MFLRNRIKWTPDMERRVCGTTDLELSVLGFGCWQFGDDTYWRPAGQSEVDRVVARAVDMGVTYFDTAEAYADGESERMLGKALRHIPRDRVEIGTKVAPSNAYPDQLQKHCEESLRRLGTDYIDLYMVHWPFNRRSLSFFTEDEELLEHPPNTADVFESLERLREDGKIRHAGVSNFGVDQMNEALEFMPKMAVNQVAYNLLSRAIEYDVLPLCRREGVGVIGYSALMQGILAGAYESLDAIPELRTRTRHFDADRSDASRHGEDGAEALVEQALEEIRSIAGETGDSMADLSLKWSIAREGIASVLVGSTSPEHLEGNVEAVNDPLPPAVVERLDEVTEPVKEALGSSIDYYEGRATTRSH